MPAKPVVSLNGISVKFADQVKKYPCITSCLTVKMIWIHRGNWNHFIAQQARSKAPLYSTAVKKHIVSCILYANVCLSIVMLWYTQSSIKRLRVALNNAYRISHTTPGTLSIRSHQVTYFVRTFDALVGNNLFGFLHLHPVFCPIVTIV